MTRAEYGDRSGPAPSGDLEAESRDRPWVVAGAVAVVLLLLLAPVLGGRYYVMDDLGAYMLPVRADYADHLARGESLSWTPHIYGGYYLLGDANTGSQHPAIHLLYRFLPLHPAYTIEILARYPLALLGAFLMLRRWGLPAGTALFGAATLSFGGYFLMRACHVAMVGAAAHLPWLLLAADVLLRDESPRRARWAWLGVALLTGSQWLIGFPPLPYMSAQAELVYVLLLWARARPAAGRSWPGCWRRCWAPSSAAPDPADARDHDAIGADRQRDRLGPERLAPSGRLAATLRAVLVQGRSYLNESVSHETSLYCGSAATILAAWAVIRGKRLGPLRPWVGVALAFVVIGLLFAMGRYGGLGILQYYLPVVGKLRIPARYILVIHVGLAALAAIGLADLSRARSDERREPRALWLLLIVPLAQVAWLGAGFVRNGFHPPEWFAWRALSIAIFLAAFLLVCASSRRVRYAFPLLIAFAMADQVFYASARYARQIVLKQSTQPLSERSPLNVATDLAPVMTLAQFTDLVPPCPARGHERVAGVEGDLNVTRGLYSIEGYVSLTPRRTLDYRRPAARRVAGVRWELNGLGAGATWDEVAGALPYARLVAQAVASEDPRRTIEEIDPETTAIVAEPLDLPPGDVGAAAVDEEHPGNLTITATAPARRLLVVAESYHPGWRASVDGRWLRPIRVYGDFLGVVVPEGRHRVEFAFRPWSLRLGPWISAAGLGLALLLFAAAPLVPRRRSQAAGRDRLLRAGDGPAAASVPGTAPTPDHVFT